MTKSDKKYKNIITTHTFGIKCSNFQIIFSDLFLSCLYAWDGWYVSMFAIVIDDNFSNSLYNQKEMRKI